MVTSVLTPVYRGDLEPLLGIIERMSKMLEVLALGTIYEGSAQGLSGDADTMCARMRQAVVPTGVEVPASLASWEVSQAATSIIKRTDELPWNTFIEGTPV